MFVERMDASIRKQSHKMNLFVIITGIRECVCENSVFFNIACFAFLIYFNQILINHSSCSDIQMSYFGVSHLPLWQANIFS